MIGRLGRSLGVHLLLASQRLEEGRLRGLETHLSYRIGLRTFSAMESRGGARRARRVRAAARAGQRLPEVGRTEHDPVQGRLRLRSLPAAQRAARGRRAPGSPGQIVPWYGTERRAAAAAARGRARARRRRTGEQQRQPARHRWSTGCAARARRPTRSGCRRWTSRPRSTSCCRRSRRPRRTGSPPPAGPARGRLTRAGRHRRQARSSSAATCCWSTCPAAAGNVGVVGGAAERQEHAAAHADRRARAHPHPAEVQFYCLDFGGGTLAGAGRAAARRRRGRPARHRPGPPDGRRDARLLAARERLFAERGIDSIATYRRPRAAGEFAERRLRRRVPGRRRLGHRAPGVRGARGAAQRARRPRPRLRHPRRRRGQRGRSSGPACATCSAPGWSCGWATRSSRRSTARPPPACPSGAPGRGLTRGRRCTSSPRCPASTARPPPTTWPTASPTLVDAVAAPGTGRRRRPVRLLPDRAARTRRCPDRTRRGQRIPLGIDEAALAPVLARLRRRPAPPRLRRHRERQDQPAAARSPRASSTGYTPEEARIVIVDYRRSLLDAADTEHRIGYAASSAAAATRAQRHPRGRCRPAAAAARPHLRAAAQPELVDRPGPVRASSTTTTWWPRPPTRCAALGRSAAPGPRHRAAPHPGAGHGRRGARPVRPGHAADQGDGHPGRADVGPQDEGALFGNVRPQQLPPGRGFFVDRRSGARLIQTAYLTPPEAGW